jgi:CDP-diacylglycerol--glycerol-3-phosphate 3-phosphatidyltransferase
MDGCDGAIARQTNRATHFGGFFDSVMDRVSEFFIFLALLIFTWNELFWDLIEMKFIIFLSLIGSIMISYSRTRAENIFKGDFDVGLMARSERIFYLFITSLLAFFYGFFNEFLFIFMCLVMGTAFFRCSKLYKEIKKREHENTK